jgi:uncharacterized protein YcbX
MLGEPCESPDVHPRGVAGDRLFAIRDAHGRCGSGTRTRRFRRIDGLFGFQAVYADDVPVMRFPDGRTMRGDHPAIHTALSHTLGRPVTLAREAGVAHVDAGPVHLLTTAALAWRRAMFPGVDADARRFRPNLVLDVPGATPVGRGWLGKRRCVGEAVRLRVRAATERCGMVAFAQAELPYDARILRGMTREAARHFGVYAEVLVPGRITRGDGVTVMDEGEWPLEARRGRGNFSAVGHERDTTPRWRSLCARTVIVSPCRAGCSGRAD